MFATRKLVSLSNPNPAAVVLAAVLVLLCGGPSVSGAGDFAFVTTTDYSTGSCSKIGLVPPYAATKNLQSIHSDAVARYYGGLIYVVNRYLGDNIQILNPATGFSTVRQFSVGNGSDPHDIVVLSPTKAYVTRYNATRMWIVNPSTGLQTGSIDFSSFADVDGIPEMHEMILVGTNVFVTVQRIDRNTWGPAGQSYVAVIDINTDTFVDTDPGTPGTQAIALSRANPYSTPRLDPYGGFIYFGCAGFWGLRDGGVETIDPYALSLNGTIFTETAAGGDFLDVEIVLGQYGFAVIQNASFNTELITFDPQTGLKTGTVYNPGAYVIQDINVSPTREIFLADRTPVAPGIRVYDAATATEITTGPIDVGLPPFDITFSVPVQTGVPDVPAAASLGRNYPNPFNPLTTIPFSLERETRVTLSVYDISGKLVATLLDEVRDAGPHQVTWDASTPSHAGRAASGVYFVELKADGFRASQKLILLK